MKLIPQEIVEKAVWDNINSTINWATPQDSDGYNEFEVYAAFKAGVEFAEKELENINIEFADWLVKNGYIPLQKLCWSKDSTTYTSKTLFERFLKERKL